MPKDDLVRVRHINYADRDTLGEALIYRVEK